MVNERNVVRLTGATALDVAAALVVGYCGSNRRRVAVLGPLDEIRHRLALALGYDARDMAADPTMRRAAATEVDELGAKLFDSSAGARMADALTGKPQVLVVAAHVDLSEIPAAGVLVVVVTRPASRAATARARAGVLRALAERTDLRTARAVAGAVAGRRQEVLAALRGLVGAGEVARDTDGRFRLNGNRNEVRA